MPFFSFIAKDKNQLTNDFNISLNKVYFSKSTIIWKKINKIKENNNFTFKKVERIKLSSLGNNILFLLPPSIGLGDAIEYAHAIKAVKDKKIFDTIGIAFTESYAFIFNKYFGLRNNYSYYISQKELSKYDTLFHFTLELNALKFQKIFRSNIKKEILKYFKIKKIVSFTIKTKNKKKIKKISIFPISNSPIRTMPKRLLINLINYLKNNYLLDVYIDSQSIISNNLIDNIDLDDVNFVDCKKHEDLVLAIKNIEYGIFMDSGPLHVANLFEKKGILIESTVSKNILLGKESKIIALKNNYISENCKSPCGLTDLFNFQNNIGCYNTLKISKSYFFKNKLLSYMHNRNVKNNYTRFIKKPVQCLDTLNIQKIITYINNDLIL